jgi:hypothetical protein
MKTATLLLTVVGFTAPYAYSQAAAGYGGAAAASTTTAAGAAGGLGRATGGALSKIGSATANASGGSTSSGTVQVSRTTLSATRARRVSAELTQRLNSKDAKIGDEVVARITSPALLAGGVRLPMGTKLIGKVTEVQAESGNQHDGHLAFAFHRAVTSAGRQIAIHAALDSISAPRTAASTGVATDAGGTGARRTPLVSGGAPMVASAPIRVIGAEGTTVYDAGGAVSHSSGATFAALSNLPGIAASSSVSNSTILDAKDSNIVLSNGTQLTLTVATN